MGNSASDPVTNPPQARYDADATDMVSLTSAGERQLKARGGDTDAVMQSFLEACEKPISYEDLQQRMREVDVAVLLHKAMHRGWVDVTDPSNPSGCQMEDGAEGEDPDNPSGCINDGHM